MPLSLDGTGSITGIGTFNFSDEIVHVGDDNTKIRFPANDTISFETSGSEKLRIASDGNIGMGGNTNPTNVLHIKTAVTNTAVATIESTATNSYPLLRLKNDAREYQLTCHGGLSDAFTIYDGTSAAHRFTITSAGYVGINQTNPVRPLHITGNDGGSGATSGNSDTTIIVDNAGTNGSMIEFLNANNGAGHLMFTDTDGTNRGRISYHHNGDYFRFDTGGTERLRIDSNGFITQPGQCSFRATKSGGGYTHSTGTLAVSYTHLTLPTIYSV